MNVQFFSCGHYFGENVDFKLNFNKEECKELIKELEEYVKEE